MCLLVLLVMSAILCLVFLVLRGICFKGEVVLLILVVMLMLIVWSVRRVLLFWLVVMQLGSTKPA